MAKSMMSWRYGDTWSRVFNAMFLALFGGLLVLVPLLVVRVRLPAQAFWGLVLVYATFPAFNEVFVAGMVTADVWRAGIRLGVFSSEEAAYYEEVARYIDAAGKGGRLPGALPLTLGFWVVFYGLIAAAIPFTLLLLPALGWLAHVAFAGAITPVAAGCLWASRRWRTRVSEDAKRRGFRLDELKESMRRARVAA